MLDFNENCRCRYQKEAPNAFHKQIQVTVHPSICYYTENVPTVNDDKDETEKRMALND